MKQNPYVQAVVDKRSGELYWLADGYRHGRRVVAEGRTEHEAALLWHGDLEPKPPVFWIVR